MGDLGDLELERPVQEGEWMSSLVLLWKKFILVMFVMTSR
jgi:hypothetical protein